MSKETTANSVTGEMEMPDGCEIEVPSRRHEVLGVIATLLALVVLLALISYDGLTPEGEPIAGGNIIGPAGMWIAHFSFTALGAAVFLLDLAIWIYAACLFVGRAGRIRIKGAIGVLMIGFLASVALHTMLHGTTILGGYAPGGFIGTVFGEIAFSMVSTTGTYIISLGGIVLVLLIVTDISLFLAVRALGLALWIGAKAMARISMRVIRAWKEQPAVEDVPAPKIVLPVNEEDASPGEAGGSPASAEEPKIVKKTKRTKKSKKSSISRGDALVIDQAARGEFQLPSLELLEMADEKSTRVDEKYLKSMAERLVKVLADFGVAGVVGEIHPGPVVTMFEFQPQSGIKLSKIGGLSNEIAMALEVKRVRVVAPIPGKNAVGFELPNKGREMVRLREILEDDSFSKSRFKLPMALGKDIAGMPFTADLAKMPHLLMAGTTGSGKSVAVNTMLLSLLFRYTPEDLRLLLIDPKMIEFQPYNEIPHLLLPVVTDMNNACLALKWAVDEMERRYQLFADMGSRSLASYNAKVEKILEKAKDKKDEPRPKVEILEDGTIVEFGPADRPEKKLPEKLPIIVICIDELADLMMTAAKDVETSIARIAQKARAAGLHLIVATQRPSTDVVTGLIKANFPSRMSCQVAQGVDSRTILGSNGAEALLGNGDMLFLPPGSSDLIRLQGAFVSEEEIGGVIEFLKAQGNPTYDDEILKPREDDATAVNEEEKDEIYDEAVSLVAQAQTCSISMIQRKLRIGYNRSARIVELMEREGVIGPANGVNKREVHISPL